MSDTEKPANTAERDELMQAIADRVIAAGGTFDEDRVRAMVREEFDAVAADPEFVRKIRFGGEPENRGTKFVGMTDDDLDFAVALVASMRNHRLSNGDLSPGPSEELVRAASEARERLDKTLPASYGRVLHDTRHGLVRDPEDTHVRAMDTAESGYGSQLVGVQYVGSLWEAARRTSRVWPLIDTFAMTAPSAYLPVEVDFPDLQYVGESTASNSANYATTKTGSNRVSCTAKKFVMHQMHSGEMEEDSLIPFVPFLRGQATKALAWHQDALVLRGDTTTSASSNLNDVDGTPDATDWFLAWDGIIHGALVDNTGNRRDAAGAPTWEDFMEMKKLMYDRTYFHDWGHPSSPGDLVIVAEPATADTIALLGEVATVDKYGSQATVLTGEVGNILRHPLIVCDSLVLTESTGFVDKTVSDNTKGIAVMFNRSGYKLGIRRALKVETERLPATDQMRIVYSMRWGFVRYYPAAAASGIESVAVLYDITV